MTLSRDRENYDGKVYVNLVDKADNNKVIESLEVSPGDIKTFNKITEKVKDESFTGNPNFNFTISVASSKFENDGKPLTYYFPNIESGVGDDSTRNTIVYSAKNEKDVGTKINNLGTIVPFSPMEQETSYILKETKYRPESILAEYINSGGIFGDKYTIPGAADFDKYELIEKPKVESGDLKNVTVGTYQMKTNNSAKTAIVKLNTKEDGTQK